MKCAAILAKQWRHQQPWIKCCENTAVALANGIPLCGIHVNSPPAQVAIDFVDRDIQTVEKVPKPSPTLTPIDSNGLARAADTLLFVSKVLDTERLAGMDQNPHGWRDLLYSAAKTVERIAKVKP